MGLPLAGYLRPERSVRAVSFAVLAGVLCLAGLQGCITPAPPPAVNLDGIWVSPHLSYDLELLGPLGVAVQVRSGTAQNGDPVFRIVSLEGTRLTARQWLNDGAWHTVTGEWKDGKLYCQADGAQWVLERRDKEIPADVRTKGPIMP